MDVSLIATRRHFHFPGSAWPPVLAAKWITLHSALVADVAEQLSVQESHVADVSFTSALKALFTVFHAPTLTRHEVDVLLSEGHFTRMWELYMETESPRSAQKCAISLSAAAETTGFMHISRRTTLFMDSCAVDAVTGHRQMCLERAEWDAVTSESKEQLRKAFVADVEAAVSVSRDAVQSVAFQLGTLAMDYAVVHAPTLDRKEMDSQLKVFKYPRTCAVYLGSTAKKAQESATHTTVHHHVKLEGDV
ncbi:hypothetical protein Q4I28_007215 [Leishmania naiffi]|uniref:Flagellar attachment zone protein 1 conserved domain-containing protein n=1 Tax=Leishmania naiffi TaxID=5678 RepID=A0AAW3BBY3_9TRYP